MGSASLVWTVPVLLMAATLGWSLRPRGPGRADGVNATKGPARSLVTRGAAVMRRFRPGPDVDVGAVLTEVAARLHAGAKVEQAWANAMPPARSAPGPARDRGTAGRARAAPGDGTALMAEEGVPPELDALMPSSPRWGRPPAHQVALAHQVAGAQVACRVAHRLGAPLAQVLDACAEGVIEAGRARAARSAALAAPRATARLLGWLPLVGVGLGSALGADPVGILLAGGWGTLCLVAGAVLMTIGHLWSAHMVRAAERAGS